MTLPRLDQFNFHATLATIPGPALVFFSAAGCASCRQWQRLLSEWMASGTAYAVFEVDVGQDQGLAREFDLWHLPALFLFVDGVYHRPIQAPASRPQLEAALAAALRLPAQEAP